MQTGIISYKRHFPPAHYSLKVQSYSLLSKTEKYESEIFEAGGYKWRLTLYPNGDKNNNGSNYISLYLSIAETDNFTAGWEVNVIFHLLLYDQLNDTYLTIQDSDGSVKRFHEMKTKWGFAQLLSHVTFKNPRNGYLIDDCFVVGAEVFVIKHSCNFEYVSLVKSPYVSDATFTWTMNKFSSLNNEYYRSKVFSAGQKNWDLMVFPNGGSMEKDKSISIFFEPVGWESKAAVFAEYKICVIDQVNGKHLDRSVSHCFFQSEKNQGWGFRSFMPLKDLSDSSRGFVVKNTVIVKVEFLVISETKVFSENKDSAEEPQSPAAPKKRKRN